MSSTTTLLKKEKQNNIILCPTLQINFFPAIRGRDWMCYFVKKIKENMNKNLNLRGFILIDTKTLTILSLTLRK